MLPLVLISTVLWIQTAAVENYIYIPNTANRSTISGIAAYRSALTLDWMADEDSRQRELAGAFETEATPQGRVINTDCIVYPRPASGKVARLMLELLKNLEGDEGMLINELTQALIRSKLLVETFMLDAEPDLEALVKTPGVMLGEPYASFPRVLAMVWMAATDPTTTKRHGWCLISKVTKFLRVSRPVHVAEQLRAMDPVIARARFIIEEFIQHVTPINVFDKKIGVTKFLRVSRPVHVAEQLRALDPVIARARFIIEEFIQHVTPINVFDKKIGAANANGNWKSTRSERDDAITGTSVFTTEPTRTFISAILAGPPKRQLAHSPVDLGTTKRISPSAHLLAHPAMMGPKEELEDIAENEVALPQRQTDARKRSASDVVRSNNVVALAFAVMFL